MRQPRTLADLLAADREEAEAVADQEEARAVYEMETRAEQAWLTHAERFDPEAQADLERFNMEFPDRYG